MRILLTVAETSGLCQGAFGSRAVLVHKPRGYPAKDDLRCCALCMFTKYYCFDGVWVDMFCCKDFDQVVPVYLQMVVCLPSILTFHWQLHFPACLQVLDECLCDRTLSRELFKEQYATQSKVIKSLLKIIWDIFSSLNLWNVANKEFTFWMSIVYSCYLNINKNLWASFSQVSLRIVERSLIGKNSRTCGVFTCVVFGFF